MIIYTNSGPVSGSKRDRYMHWLQGRRDSGAWCGHATIAAVWQAHGEQVLTTRTMREAYLTGYYYGLGEQYGMELPR